jgi:hypothetical protein
MTTELPRPDTAVLLQKSVDVLSALLMSLTGGDEYNPTTGIFYDDVVNAALFLDDIIQQGVFPKNYRDDGVAGFIRAVKDQVHMPYYEVTYTDATSDEHNPCVAYIPVSLVQSHHGNVKAAFEQFTGVEATHVISCDTVHLYTKDGGTWKKATSVPELHPGMTSSLFDFICHVIEYKREPDVTTFTTDDGMFEVTWQRPRYSGDRVGMDHFIVYQHGQEWGTESMFNDVDEAGIRRLAALIQPGHLAEEIRGTVS